MIARALAMMTLLAGPAFAGPLVVEVSGAQPAEGQVLATLFRGAEAWMTTPAAERVAPVAPDGSARIAFGEQPAGTYGVSLVHDENANGALDLNLLGIPSEAFGFSNDAAALIGVPGWDKVRFDLGETGARLQIRLGRAE